MGEVTIHDHSDAGTGVRIATFVRWHRALIGPLRLTDYQDAGFTIPGRHATAAGAWRAGRQVTGVPVVAVRSANRAVSCLVTGPGLPSPMVRPSTPTTGTSPPMVPVTNASSAV